MTVSPFPRQGDQAPKHNINDVLEKLRAVNGEGNKAASSLASDSLDTGGGLLGGSSGGDDDEGRPRRPPAEDDTESGNE